MTHLDTRKERPLTSREIAKIIGGIIGGSIGAGASPDDLLVMFRSAQAFLQGHSEVGPSEAWWGRFCSGAASVMCARPSSGYVSTGPIW